MCVQYRNTEIPSDSWYTDIPAQDLRRWMFALKHLPSDTQFPGESEPSVVVDRVSNWPRFRGFKKDWSLFVGFFWWLL